MAKVCVWCKMLSAIFLLILTSTFDYSHQESLREINSTTQTELKSTTPSSSLANSSMLPSVTNVKSDQSQSNVTQPPILRKPEIPHKNLGENGTGIWKNITRDDRIIKPTVLTLNTTEIATIANGSIVDNNSNQTIDADDDLIFPNPFDEAYNKTLAENNITKTVTDYHQYYNSTLSIDPAIGHSYWVNMSHSAANISDLLSHSHRRAATVRLSFEFPFYGHLIRNITIATGGFLYTGEYVHSWLAATQYIAPLMANFDTSLSNNSFIKYYDNGTAFTVHWENVALQDKPNGGNFTFQTTLFKNGDIVFVYEKIPFAIEQIQDDHHPVKVGLSDAYISDRTIFFVRRKTIFEYHRVVFNHGDIKNFTSIYLRALPTCLSNKDCASCVSKPVNNFKCLWCPGINRCSSGMDRNRQDWLSRGCDRKKVQDKSMCNASEADLDNGVDIANNSNLDGSLPHYKTVTTEQTPMNEPQQQPRVTNTQQEDSMGVSGIVTILFLISIVLGLGIWLTYAYRNPHSTSGQILIRYRPSQWSWRRGEARYTAATIHM